MIDRLMSLIDRPDVTSTIDCQSSHECLLVGELRILGAKKQSAAMFQWGWKSSPLLVEVCCFDATMELLLVDLHGQYNN